MSGERSTSRGRSGYKTSLGGGKVKQGHRAHGFKDIDDKSSKNRSRARSKSRDRTKNKPRREYDTPFDEKGRCHYHWNVQLAAKKMTGGWKVLCQACPKCMEEGNHNDDMGSVKSGKSVKSASSRGSRAGGGGGEGNKDGKGGNGKKKFDSNGCCLKHPHLQVAKKKMLGGGWKIIRNCPACEGKQCDMDDVSVKSGRSAKSTSSRRSNKSSKSAKSGGGKSKSRPGKATQSGRYGALPFDGDGYCCRHPNVQLAQKKMIGGFKIIHDVCPQCAKEDGTPSRRKSGSHRSRSVSRDRRRNSSRNINNDDESKSSAAANDETSTKKKKRIRVKNLKTEDEHGRPGRYSGYVNDDHIPHGNGMIRYENGDEWEGVWSEGSQVHGKMKKGSSSGK